MSHNVNDWKATSGYGRGWAAPRLYADQYAGPQHGEWGADEQAVADVLALINPTPCHPEEAFYDDELGYALPRPRRRQLLTEWDDPFESEIATPWRDDPDWGTEQQLVQCRRGAAA